MNENRILLVDDESAIRAPIAKAFMKKGYLVDTAESAEAALAAMRQNPASVLFLDLNLPGMNGLQLCREIRRGWPWAIAFAVTGYASVFDLVACRESGFEDYFVKPVPLQDLLGAAEHAFAKIQRWKKR